MAGPTDQQPPQAAGTPVPDLIERYRLRRDAWIAQADELARLRDEVRGSAEREAMEIVTAARREVRQVIMEARRELLVLSAQVQAALGEATNKTDPAALLHKAGIMPAEEAQHGALSAASSFVPEGAVDEILNEVRADMAALDEDARALPLQAVQPIKLPAAPPSPAMAPAPVPAAITLAPQAPIALNPPAPIAVTPRPEPAPRPTVVPEFRPSAPPAPASTLLRETPALSEAASRALLSSQFPSEAVPVPSGRGLLTFVALFVGIGLVVVLGTMWWFRAPPQADALTTAAGTTAESTVTAPPPGEPAAAVPEVEPPVRVGAASGNLSVVAEAVRDVWVRTTVDGQADGGRTLSTGQVIDVSAEQSISLRVGDAGAIVVSVNRGEKRPLGRDGQVVTRQFLVEESVAPRRPPSPVVPPRQEAPARAPADTPTVAAPLAQPLTPPSAPLQSVAAQPIAGASSAPVTPAPQAASVAPPPPRGEAAAPATGTSPATAVVAAARQWLDAYHRQDRATMAALSMDNLLLADERRTEERFPPGQVDVTRSLDRVSVQIAADTAVLTAVMTEQSVSAPGARVSPVSQVWVLAGGGQWKVRQARFVSEARLNQVFTR
jgi:hypothetical protein